jgi:hypothetical protein
MRLQDIAVIVALALVVFLLFFNARSDAAVVSMSTGVGYTNENITHSPHSRVASMTMLPNGEFEGTLENGSSFTQTNIVNNFTRLQRFQVDQAWWYISDKGVIGYGEGLEPIIALSIYLAR